MRVASCWLSPARFKKLLQKILLFSSIIINERNGTESGRPGREPAEAPGRGFAHLSLHCTRLLLLCLDISLLFWLIHAGPKQLFISQCYHTFYEAFYSCTRVICPTCTHSTNLNLRLCYFFHIITHKPFFMECFIHVLSPELVS